MKIRNDYTCPLEIVHDTTEFLDRKEIKNEKSNRLN